MTKIFHPLLALIASASDKELAKYVQFLKVWLCVGSREVIVSTSTEHPNSSWVTEQAERFISETNGREHSPALVMHDRDTKFTKEFTEALNRHGVATNPLPKASPNLNGRCERFIDTIKLECLNKFIVFGKTHLDHLVSEFVDYYNHHRSHMERDHLPPVREEPNEVETIPLDEIQLKTFVGGLVKSFARKTA